MKSTLCLLCAICLLVPHRAGGEDGLVTVDTLMQLRTVNEVRISPDGRHVAYTVSSPDFGTDAHEAALFLVPAAGGAPRRLTHTTRIFNRPLPSPGLRWSPDGRQISFLGLVNDLPQVLALRLDGGEPTALTAAAAGAGPYEWSPDGTRLAYLAPDPPDPGDERRRRERSFVIQVDRQDRPTRVWVQPVDGGAATALTPQGHFVSGLSWSADGQTIVYSAAPMAGFNGQFHSRIYAIAASGGEPRALVDRTGMNTSPQVSPDGNWVAFVSTGGRAEMISIWGLHVVGVKGPHAGEIRNLSATNHAWAGEFVWSPDSRSLLMLPEESTVRRGARMFERPLLRISLDGTEERLTPGASANYSPSLSRDGRLVAYRSVDPRSMGDVYLLDLGSRDTTRLTEINPVLRTLRLGEVAPISWTSFDGMEIWGLLLTPPGHVPGRRVPLVVYCHGGPIGGFTYGLFPQFMHRMPQVDPYPVEALASAGMAVLFPMPRGGSGYGEAGFRMIVNSWGVGDYKDIMAGVDHLIAQGLADPERLGVMGASYGGFMTSWIVTQTGRFKAASTGASVTSLEDLYYLSDGGDVMAEYFGQPWEHRDLYTQHSPVTHAARVTTPLLIQHGENDRRVPLPLAQKFYRALKAHGKLVELDVYPRAGHVVYEPDLQREQMKRNLEWFRRWLLVE